MKIPPILRNRRTMRLVVVLVVLVGGFVVDRVMDDGSGGSGDESAEQDSSSDDGSSDDATTPADDSAPDGSGSDDTIVPVDTDGPSDDASSDTVEERGPPPRYSDLPIVTLDELPSEALDTLELIEAGGPYPYRQDDSTFQNREGILPAREHGHYREYTVETPGSSDRGARRIVAGADGERYWTDDHYDSFSEIQF